MFLGLYKEGSIRVVAPPPNCPIISTQMHQVIAHFHEYLLTKTQLRGYNPVTHEGHWRQILVRSTCQSDCLVSIAMHQQNLTEEQLSLEISQLKQFYSENKLGIISVYVQVNQDRSSQFSQTIPQLIWGESYVFEKLTVFKDVQPSSLEFRISPLSFFQVNTPAAEYLYTKIIEATRFTSESTILDICCGTGTIGLSLARNVRKVVGIELNKDAIEDARFNAQHNKIDNVQFECGRAEKLIGQILNNLSSSDTDVIAIIDPPRSGLGKHPFCLSSTWLILFLYCSCIFNQIYSKQC